MTFACSMTFVMLKQHDILIFCLSCHNVNTLNQLYSTLGISSVKNGRLGLGARASLVTPLPPGRRILQLIFDSQAEHEELTNL